MIDSEKIYLCTTHDPHIAALLYDITVIQAKGLSSKVNFMYSKDELLAILFNQSLVEIKKKKRNQLKRLFMNPILLMIMNQKLNLLKNEKINQLM